MQDSPDPRTTDKGVKRTASFPVYVISGGVGSSGEQLVRTVLAQFPNSDVSIQVFPKVNTKKHKTFKKHLRQVLFIRVSEEIPACLPILFSA